MKNVILSADGDSAVYSVPDAVADELEKYCLAFCTKWLRHSPDAAKYRTQYGVCYTEADFIDYLNRYVFPEEESAFVANLGRVEREDEIPAAYRNCPRFLF